MTWKAIDHLEQINKIKEESKNQPVLIFKHSTSCSISGMAWNRLQRNWQEGDFEKVSPYVLDLLSYRDISNAIAQEFAVDHESPQVILLKDGMAFYDTSHMGINYQDIIDKV
ncbi:bacillithiol system redox-active protein YtxJ [Echinicola strongylocentroti]|uniref:Bacillithiol system redox-active protein YtxJ n=1 Tax=Echinicola strongylocentroti TaxID=1795355 RepID=A0A2Z4IJ75_9BACT|nr:bacillithiol system redox-active protein YtxJ [Echinicola strongylocentroti]AWW30578.1 bacillithiol system redox-active protein YtxJ [Echinicola strongylocentroti]